jgi:HK97 family phage prohead protease
MSKKPTIINGQKVLKTELFETEVKALSEDELEVVGSTGSMDRDGEVVEPTAWDLKNFKKNPVILAGHDYHSPAIARATNVKLEDGKLKFKIKFPTEGAYPIADIDRKLYKEGIMSATSVGFIAREWQDGDGKAGKPWRTYTKAELLELSLVTVPSNPEALVMQRGILNDDEVKLLKGIQKTKAAENVENLPEVEPIEEGQQKDNDVEGQQSDLEAVKRELAEIKQAVSDYKIKVDALEGEVAKLSTQKEIPAEETEPKHYLDIDDPAESDGEVSEDIVRSLVKSAFEA